MTASPSFLCSACYTPCQGADAHVIPRWNPSAHAVLTTYRCGNCWPAALDELRGVFLGEQAEPRNSFCDFLTRRGYGDAAGIMARPADQQLPIFLAIVDALEDGRLRFDP